MDGLQCRPEAGPRSILKPRRSYRSSNRRERFGLPVGKGILEAPDNATRARQAKLGALPASVPPRDQTTGEGVGRDGLSVPSPRVVPGATTKPCAEGKNRQSTLDVGEDPGSDPAVAAEIDRTLSLLPRDIPGENR
jgi:hypothetical protein